MNLVYKYKLNLLGEVSGSLYNMTELTDDMHRVKKEKDATTTQTKSFL